MIFFSDAAKLNASRQENKNVHVVRKRSPCYILTNSKCATHLRSSKFFGMYSKEAEKTFDDLHFDVCFCEDLTEDDLQDQLDEIKEEKLHHAGKLTELNIFFQLFAFSRSVFEISIIIHIV